MSPPRYVRASLLAAAATGLVACGSDMGSALQMSNVRSALGLSGTEDDPSVIKVGEDATVPIIVSSNKQATVFTVNGTDLSPAKMLKVMVPKARLRIRAEAPCYQPLEQTADANGFGPWSSFPFLFANHNRRPGARGANCE